MKNRKICTTSIFRRVTRFLGAVLTVAFLVPAVALSQSSPLPVNLGTSGDFVIIAKTGISTTGTTQITGDIGISPAHATYITGFGLIMDASTTFSISTLVTGKVYASDYTIPTPTKMTTAIGDMNTAYNDAAGRLSPDYTELYTGDLTGRTLSPGLYKWGTGVQVNGGGVTISGSATDVWIFQIAQNLEFTSGAIVTLSGGARASNIFWQVAGQVNLGTTVAMKGNILCKTLIAMNTGASLTGRALAQSAVTLQANSVTTIETVNNIGTDWKGIPVQYMLEQNFPNPFNPSTTIQYAVPEKSIVRITIYNLIGQQVAILVNEIKDAGYHSVEWNPVKMTSGVYFYELKADKYQNVKKLLLLK
jgi:hypothetical protein